MLFREILDQIKARHGLDTDYKAAKILQISQSRMSKALKNNSTPDDDPIIEAENLLELPPGSLLMKAHAERTKCKQAAQIFSKLAQELGRHAASIFLAVSITYTMGSSLFFEFAPGFFAVHQCILCKIKNFLIWELFLKCFSYPFWVIRKFRNLSIFSQILKMTNGATYNNYYLSGYVS